MDWEPKRAAELRGQGKKGAKKADGLQAGLARIAEMAPGDRALAERVHMAVTATAPVSSPRGRWSPHERLPRPRDMPRAH